MNQNIGSITLYNLKYNEFNYFNFYFIFNIQRCILDIS